jgi:starch-binding outer membrane protein, SusD/RagB family
MKKVYNYLIAFAMLLFGATSCTDVLDQDPVNSAKLEDVFSDIGLAKAFLGNCYDKMGGDGGVLGMREDLLASNTDQCLCIHRPTDFKFVKGNDLSPDALGHIGSTRFGFLNWGGLYGNIQRVNTFLANIENVPTTSLTLIPQMKGEAYFIRAYDYAQLLFGYGGVVLTDEPFTLGQDFLTITRSTLQQTKDFILADIAQAISLLPAKMEQGRATRAAAAALKSRLLLFCASTLVNGGYEPTNTLVSFTTGSQTERWTEARDAANAIMNGTYGTFSLVGTTTDPPSPLSADDIKKYSDNYFNLFIQKSGAWNSESIWGIQYNITGGNTQRINIWDGPCGYHNWGNNDPTEPAVRKFEMADGTKFQWDVYTPGNQVLRTATAAELAADPLRSPYNGREPRFYATVLYHGATWQQRPTDAAGMDPLNIVQTGHFYNDDGTLKANGLDTRQGLIEAWNGTKNGYYLKKFMDPLSQGQFFNNTNSWIEFRYAEILLNYAEACIELGGADLQNGIDALNVVRNRAGLPDRVTADQATARDYLRHERYIEFFAEGHQWYDMRRWMTAASLIENVYEMKIKQFTNGNMEWKLDLGARADQRSFVLRNYWIPLPRDEMNKAPQLQQTPGF